MRGGGASPARVVRQHSTNRLSLYAWGGWGCCGCGGCISFWMSALRKPGSMPSRLMPSCFMKSPKPLPEELGVAAAVGASSFSEKVSELNRPGSPVGEGDGDVGRPVGEKPVGENFVTEPPSAGIPMTTSSVLSQPHFVVAREPCY